MPPALPRVVIDTNIVLDLWVFDDSHSDALRLAVQEQRLQWIATQAMRDEFVRVLDYPAIVRARQRRGLDIETALARFEAHVAWVPAAPACGILCADADDQGFIDLAVAHRAWLLSKDAAVLALQRGLHDRGVRVAQPLEMGKMLE